ncbi:unnamed protein product [Spirodela intermedia]|uniref:Uncharacterized protein n=1 Tax=Spirodela intermedia TaxID=51605 RepID=A0ABN7EC88_SPIIN|nr:unnamed protein product [Spirodela intermedia]
MAMAGERRTKVSAGKNEVAATGWTARSRSGATGGRRGGGTTAMEQTARKGRQQWGERRGGGTTVMGRTARRQDDGNRADGEEAG